MRVTQSMLSNNMMRNLSTSYSKMGKLQEQLTSKKKINSPSDDPVVAMKGIGYRTDLGKIEQYSRNLGEVTNWLDNSDTALDQVGNIIHRVHELVIDGANDTKTDDDRLKIKSEIDELRKQLQSISNTKVGDKFLFNGTNTLTPVFKEDFFSDGTFTGTLPAPAVPNPYPSSGRNEEVNIEISDGVIMKANTSAVDMFVELDTMMGTISTELEAIPSSGANISALLKDVSDNLGKVLEKRAELGARQNRADMMGNRLGLQEVSTKKIMSENEDVDYEKAITDLITEETVHRAALSVGARIIQPSLLDFLR